MNPRVKIPPVKEEALAPWSLRVNEGYLWIISKQIFNFYFLVIKPEELRLMTPLTSILHSTENFSISRGTLIGCSTLWNGTERHDEATVKREHDATRRDETRSAHRVY